MSMRRAIIAAIAVTAAVHLLTVSCGPDSPTAGGTAPPVNGIGPITAGADDAGVFTTPIKPWNEAHPSQRVTLMLPPQAENGQLAQLTANLQVGSMDGLREGW